MNTNSNESFISSAKKGYTLVNFCEFDKYASKAYCAIHEVDESLNLGDITKVDETKLEPFNMICGGSPCQDFSVSGKQKGSVWTCKECGHEYNPLTVHYSKRDYCPNCGSQELEKTRSSLLVEFLRVVRANKPNFGIYENVKNIVGKQFKETFKMFTDELEEYGYNVHWKVLNSKHYGIPQNRERLYLIFIKKELDNGKFEFPEPFDNGIRLKDLLEDEVDEKYYLSDEIQKRLKITDPTFTKSIVGTTKPEFRTIGQRDLVYQQNSIMGALVATDYKQPKQVLDTDDANELKQVAQMYGTEREPNPQAGRIYSASGISPTMDSCSGGNRMPKVLVPQATKAGVIECEPGGVADLSYPNSATRRGRVQDGGNTSPTITATETGVCKIDLDEDYVPRARKLTPKECYRLMNFSDEDFEKAVSTGISDSQLYKQAGNSITSNVLYFIYKELYKAMPYLFDDLRLSSYFSGIGAFERGLDLLFEDINSENFTRPLA